MSIPKGVVETILRTALSPEALGAVGGLFAAAGHPLDLGPMTPDARKHASAIDARINAELDERSELDRPHVRRTQVGGLEVVVHDTGRAPPPKPSER